MDKLAKLICTLIVSFTLINSASGNNTDSNKTCPGFVSVPMFIGGGLMGFFIYQVFPFNAEALAAEINPGVILAFMGFGAIVNGAYGCAIYFKITEY